MKETDPYDHKIVIILCCNVNELEFFRLAICNPPVGFSRHYHMCYGARIRHFFQLPANGRYSSVWRKSVSRSK